MRIYAYACFVNINTGPGEMVQRSEVLAAEAYDLSSILRTTWRKRIDSYMLSSDSTCVLGISPKRQNKENFLKLFFKQVQKRWLSIQVVGGAFWNCLRCWSVLLKTVTGDQT